MFSKFCGFLPKNLAYPVNYCVAYVVLISWHLIAARRKENRRRTPPTHNRCSFSFTPSSSFLLFRTLFRLSDGLGSEAIGRCEARLRWHQEAPEVPLRHLCHQGRLQFEDLKSRLGTLDFIPNYNLQLVGWWDPCWENRDEAGWKLRDFPQRPFGQRWGWKRFVQVSIFWKVESEQLNPEKTNEVKIILIPFILPDTPSMTMNINSTHR